jgi:copper chaperone CopZ
VKNALARLDGVAVERVAIGTATVAYDPAVASPEQIAKAVTDAGYEAVAAD